VLHLYPILEQSALNDSEEPDPELTKRTVSVLGLGVWLRVAAAGIRVYADSDCNGQGAAAVGQRSVSVLCFW
jgi:hypothetical protein